MHFLIALEQTEAGFSVQVPDLAIVTYGKTIDEAKLAAIEAIKINLDAYQEAEKEVPERKPVSAHLRNPDFADLLFAYI
ncbi:MAG: type II toxin-antitoxin system HicB family antitoxin [bacterium]|nr:type II toxin-antitoxin system HicB family antitoxin [bacterium]